VLFPIRENSVTGEETLGHHHLYIAFTVGLVCPSEPAFALHIFTFGAVRTPSPYHLYVAFTVGLVCPSEPAFALHIFTFGAVRTPSPYHYSVPAGERR
jgi:hypothetical protein